MTLQVRWEPAFGLKDIRETLRVVPIVSTDYVRGMQETPQERVFLGVFRDGAGRQDVASEGGRETIAMSLF